MNPLFLRLAKPLALLAVLLLSAQSPALSDCCCGGDESSQCCNATSSIDRPTESSKCPCSGCEKKTSEAVDPQPSGSSPDDEFYSLIPSGHHSDRDTIPASDLLTTLVDANVLSAGQRCVLLGRFRL